MLERQREEQVDNVHYQKIAKNEDILASILDQLYKNQIQSVLVEGGSKLLQSFIDAGLWDEARVITNNSLVIESGTKSPILKQSNLKQNFNILNDEVSIYQAIRGAIYD